LKERWWIWAVAAPVLVVLCLTVGHSAPAVFVVYHLGLCLVVPAVAARRQGSALARLGLTGGTVVPGMLLGLVALAAPPAVHAFWPDLFPDRSELQAVLTGWGLDAGRPGPLLLFMGLVNGPAEEIFWRGWLQPRLVAGPGSAVLMLLLFVSYHVVTIGALAPEPPGLVLMLTGVLGAGAFWMWTRWRWKSLWPALLSHTGATLGYLAVCRQILAG
jgi:membrane protease YdiL (CAAX protease family)